MRAIAFPIEQLTDARRESRERRSSNFSNSFSRLFADDVGRLFVGAQPKEDGMPRLPFTRPLGEFYLAYELRNKPPGPGLVLDLLFERLLFGAQGLHSFIKRLERRLVEAGADMPSVDPALLGFVAYRKHE